MYIIEERRKEAESSINIGKCQDSRRRPIYTTIVVTFLIARNCFYGNNRVYIYIVLIVYPKTLIIVPTISLELF